MKRIKKIHPLEWLLEGLEDHPTFLRRKMFGCEAVYLGGKLMLVLAAGDEPWNGLLIATSRDSHPELRARFPSLSPHPVLGKWLYLSQGDRSFEETALALKGLARKQDPLIGVEPKPKGPRPKRRKRPPTR